MPSILLPKWRAAGPQWRAAGPQRRAAGPQQRAAGPDPGVAGPEEGQARGRRERVGIEKRMINKRRGHAHTQKKESVRKCLKTPSCLRPNSTVSF